MTINLSNGLVGLSLLGGTNGFTSYYSAATETPAVMEAKKAFTLPETTPPWQEDPSDAPLSTQIAAIKRLKTIIDTETDNGLEDLPDVQTAFTTYKALDALRLLAESAAKKTTSSTERAALQKIFAKGLSDLQTYLGQAETDLLTLNYGLVTRRSESIGIQPVDLSGKIYAEGVSKTRDGALSGLSGNEIFSIKLTRGTATETVTVDLSTTTQPPTLDSVANALNAAIGATPALDSSGNPILDGNGNPTTQWKSRFNVEKTGDTWGLAFTAAGIEKVSIDQVNSTDALMIASGRTATDGPTSAQIFRVDDPASSLEAARLNTINAIDSKATAQAQAAAAANADEDDGDATKPTVYAGTTARAIATDAQGFSYVVGTTAGDLGSSLSDGVNDLFLTKVDSEGKVVWQRSLGAAGTGEGAAVTIAANGDIVVAGTVSGAFNGSDDSQTDMLVARFTANGTQTFATAIRQVGNENATAVAVGDDGNLYVAGRASTGGGDAVIVRLDASGKVQEKRTIDSGGADSITALAIDGSGELLALTKQGGNATLMRMDAQALSTDLGSANLGAVDARAIAVSDSGEIAVAGATSVAVNGDQANGMSGGRDAFVTRIAADLSSASTSYIGTANDDQADSITYMNGALYVGGRTTGALEGSKSGKVDGFVARIDPATGIVQAVDQWGLVTHTVEPVKIAAVTGGATALGALGLSRGALNQTVSATISSQTTLKEGDKFSLRVDGGATRTITIGKDETMATLAQKIQRITGVNGTATTAKVDGEQVLRIDVKTGHNIELIAGADGHDALAKLGMAPVRLVAAAPKDKNAPKVTPGGSYSLNLSDLLSLTDAKSASAALSRVKAALSMTQSAYRSLYWDSSKEAQVNGTITGSGSAYQQTRLAQYQAALSRLSA
ncbi:hypothetical protein DM806_25405 [Sphingobium lactosutens]|mgnify:CR=1 FL=1|uniref:hypothetical protein n=1 Tax=Sphingobium lactosutens TaxID=522773 RepID=UPI0015B8AEB5|nr:hypothetical protein [Sphingobium lactosutens]NWK98941.1 hypothetical protein [Sphingobium lactosutens]